MRRSASASKHCAPRAGGNRTGRARLRVFGVSSGPQESDCLLRTKRSAAHDRLSRRPRHTRCSRSGTRTAVRTSQCTAGARAAALASALGPHSRLPEGGGGGGAAKMFCRPIDACARRTWPGRRRALTVTVGRAVVARRTAARARAALPEARAVPGRGADDARTGWAMSRPSSAAWRSAVQTSFELVWRRSFVQGGTWRGGGARDLLRALGN